MAAEQAIDARVTDGVPPSQAYLVTAAEFELTAAGLSELIGAPGALAYALCGVAPKEQSAA